MSVDGRFAYGFAAIKKTILELGELGYTGLNLNPSVHRN
jgi:hypothetical protein